MDKAYNHKDYEEKIYKMWEESGAFTPKISPDKKPFTILLPPPNASGKMHTGNVLMCAIEDLLIRWHRMKGDPTLWVPGTDHAGFETQTTFERELKKEGKSRFDFDRQTLYDLIYKFVLDNKGLIEKQLRQMGASVDWSRYTFTLDPKAIDITLSTFEKMVKDNHIYRDNYIVNYSFKWGTTFSDAEIQYLEKIDPLYFIKYYFSDKKDGYITVATVRPETIFIDTHLAVHPQDIKKNKLIGKKVINPLFGHEMEIIADDFVDPKFGTGIVKLTPAHDKNDYVIGVKHKLPIISIIGLNGELNENSRKYQGLTILEAREQIVEELTEKDCVDKIDANYKHTVPVDYRSGDYVENLVLPNWFLRVETIKQPAYKAVNEGKIKIFPKWRQVTYLRWVESMRDWAISRQIVWGIRIPAWYNTDDNPDLRVTFLTKDKKIVSGEIKELLEKYSLEEIKAGLQRLIAPKNAKYKISRENLKGKYLPETDTFDTWFSSGQWPLTTLGYPDSEDFKYFYPTSVLETGWEIVTRWVSRMVMLGIYMTGKVPFEGVYLHGHIRAIDGRKMSKSLGNVINPDDYIQEFGVDALRMGLISGTGNGKDFNFPREKIIGYKKFGNKIWNIARFIEWMSQDNIITKFSEIKKDDLNEIDREIIKSLNKTIKKVDTYLEQFRFSMAAETIYQFVWHELADKYLEQIKERGDKTVCLGVLMHVLENSLKLLHPFMPFVTEAIWMELKGFRGSQEELLITSSWPTTS